MRRVGGIWFVVIILLVPAVVSAQNLLGLGLPGLTSFGSSCSPGDKAPYSVAGQIGYLGYNHALVFERSADGIVLGGIPNIRFTYPVEGLWLGASVGGGRQWGPFVACDPGDPFCLVLGGSWLFANNKQASEFLPADGSSRTWGPSIQWGTLYASLSCPAVWNFSVIGGFRYDSFLTKFAGPVATADFSSSDPTEEAQLSLTSYIPYVGAVAECGCIKLGVIGFPWVPGTIDYSETIAGGTVRYKAVGNYRSGQFLEASAAWGTRMGAVQVSAFATYTLLQAVANSDFSRTPIGGVAATAPHTLSFNRQNWIFGGNLAIDFNLPF